MPPSDASPPDLPASATAAGIGAQWRTMARRAGRVVLDFALPPRCPVCGVVVADDRQFCFVCWTDIGFPSADGCAQCGLPLPPYTGDNDAGDGVRCGACLTDPPPFAALGAATVYGPATRLVALRLKYGRRLGHARLMAALMTRPMGRLVGEGAEAAGAVVLVPVPLHRRRLWSRGFNQAALIAQALSRAQGVPVAVDALSRTRATPSLRGLGRAARERAVRGAFQVPAPHRDRIAGRHVVLVDDVYASGATARAAARALVRAGAARVSLLCWARVQPGADAPAEIDFARLDSDM